MNFTREPIIETIVTPREGYKIVVRNTKATHTEEYCVDAVEVVSFGGSFFFRSTERPKCFLVPVSDFELFETKENRVMLKNVGVERVKISGGRENVIKASREAPEREERKTERAIRRQKKRPPPQPPQARLRRAQGIHPRDLSRRDLRRGPLRRSKRALRTSSSKATPHPPSTSSHLRDDLPLPGDQGRSSPR